MGKSLWKGFSDLTYSNIPNTTNTYVFILFIGVKGRSPEYEEPRDLRSNHFQGGKDDAILPPMVENLIFSFAFRCIFMVENHHWRTSLKLKDPASIEASKANFHQVKDCPIFIYTCSTTRWVGEEPCSLMGKWSRKGFSDLTYSNIPNTTNIYVFILFTSVEKRSPEFQESLDLRSNPFQGWGNDAILPLNGIG